MEFSDKLKKVRKEHGMSQEELADQMNVSRQAVSKWESGQGYPETDKILMISNIFNVSLDYLLKEEVPLTEDATEPGYYASRETVEGYLAQKRKKALKIGLGVALIVLGLVFPMVRRGGMGSILFLLTAAIGGVFLLVQGFSPKNYEKLELQPLTFDPQFIRKFQVEYAQHRRRYGLWVITGVLLILLSFALKILMTNFTTTLGNRGNFILPVLWALATFLFIIAASAFKSERVIAENEKHMEEADKSRKYGWVFAAGMPLAAMVFLAIGLVWDAWHPGWLVFPITAFICMAIVGRYQLQR